jgi:hypothetical protein
VRNTPVICVEKKEEIFLQMGLDRFLVICLVGQLLGKSGAKTSSIIPGPAPKGASQSPNTSVWLATPPPS